MLRVAILLLVVIALSVGWVLGWEYLFPEMPADPPDWYGTVVAVTPAGDQPGWVALRLQTHPSEAGKPTDPDRATFTDVRADFTTGTPIRWRKTKGRTPELRPGQTVSVWCDGPFGERHPPTRPAGFIVIEE